MKTAMNKPGANAVRQRALLRGYVQRNEIAEVLTIFSGIIAARRCELQRKAAPMEWQALADVCNNNVDGAFDGLDALDRWVNEARERVVLVTA